MLGTLLLATFTGAGLAQAKVLNERANAQSYCSTNGKCSSSRQLAQATAYCVSALSIPRVTKTRTETKCATTTSTILSYTSTFTNPASTVTSTVCNCAAPTGPPLQKRAQQQATVSKPPCFSALTKASAISSACSCLSIKNGGTTTTCTTTTTTKTVKVTKKTDTTVNATPTTTYVIPTSSFNVANEDGLLWSQQQGCQKDQESGCGTGTGTGFTSDSTWEPILVALNSANQLQSDGGDGLVSEVADGIQNDNGPYEVLYNAQGDGFQPLTCSVSQAADGTCPLTCQVRSGDVNQGPTDQTTPWYLGPPGAVSPNTYKTYAVTRGNTCQRGGGRKFRGRM